MRALLLVLLLVMGVGCDGCHHDDDRSVPPAPTVKPMVPEPAGVMAKLFVPRPGHSLGALRGATEGSGLFIPQSVGGLLVNAFGLPLEAAEHFDDGLPVVGAGVVGEEGVHYAVAFHVRRTAQVIALATKGVDAKFQSEKDTGDGALEDAFFLVPTNKSIRLPMVQATLLFLDDHLVAADSREGARRLGAYLTRNLSRGEVAGTADMSVELGAGGLSELLAPMLAQLDKGLASLSAPPHVRALLDIQGMVDGLAASTKGLREATVQVAVDEVGIVVSADAQASPDVVAVHAEVDPVALASLPDDVMMALSWSESEASRRAAAEEQGGALAKALGDVLGAAWTEQDGKTTAGAVLDLALERGLTTTMGLRCTGIGITGLAMGAVAEAQKLDAAVAALVQLSTHEAVAAKLTETGVSFFAKKTRILEVPDDVWRLRLKPKAEPGEVPDEIDFLALIRSDRYFVAAGMETVDTIQRFHAPVAETSLERKKPVAAALRRLQESLGPQLWLGVMLDAEAMLACRRGKPGSGVAGPLVLGVAPGPGDRVRVRVEMARDLVQAMAREVGRL